MLLWDFFKLGAMFIIGTAIIRWVFGSFLDMGNQTVIIAYWVTLGVFATALIRRGGIINYLEALVVGLIWLVFSFFFDYLITGSQAFLGLGMFKHLYTWIGYAVVLGSIFLFHKKRHVHIRRGGHVDSHH